MDRMKGMKKVFEGMFDKPKEKRIGVITGELHDEWLRLKTDEILHDLEFEAKKAAFAYEFVKNQVVDGMFPVDLMDIERLNKLANLEFRREYADDLVQHGTRQAMLAQREAELWKKTYDLFGVDPTESYRIDVSTGELFLKVGSDDE